MNTNTEPGTAPDNSGVAENPATVEPGTAPDTSTNATALNGTDDKGSTISGEPTGFLDGLSEDTRKIAENKNWKSLDDMAKAYTNANSELSRLNSPDQWNDEQWNKFHTKRGRPEDAQGYEFKLPDGLPDDFPYDKEFAQEFKDVAFKRGMTAKEAQETHDWYIQKFAGQLGQVGEAEAERVAQSNKAIEAAHDVFVTKWGKPETATYQRQIELANRTIENLGGSDLSAEMESAGIIAVDGNGDKLVKMPQIVMALAKAGEALYSDDGMYGHGGSVHENPFHPDTLNLTKQGQLIKNDPQKAKALKQAAGVAA